MTGRTSSPSAAWSGTSIGEIGHSLKAESIRRECEASLRRLRVDAIDLYQIHWPDPDEDIEEGWATMAALQKEGKVRHIGVSNFNVAQMKRAQAIAPITSLQPRYSLLHREIEDEILPFVARGEHRRDRLFADGLGAADGCDDPRANRGLAGRRLAEGPPRFPRAAICRAT